MKFPGHLTFAEGSWPSVLLVEVVCYLFSTLVTGECDLYWILIPTSDPRLPACIPTAVRHERNVVIGYLGNPRSMGGDFAVSLTARIKDADNVPTVLWDDVPQDFSMGVDANLTRQRYCHQEDKEDEVEEVGKGDDTPPRPRKTPLKKPRSQS